MSNTLGQVKATKNATRTICLLAGTLAVNGAPSGATAGVPTYADNTNYTSDEAVCFMGNSAREAAIFIGSTAGSGTMTGTFRLWGYHAASGFWYPIGTGADGTKGQLNAVAAAGETGTDVVRHVEPVYLCGLFDRLYLEITAIGGTLTTFEAWLTTARTVSY